MNELERHTARLLIELALNEDIGDGDITTDNIIPAASHKKARMVAKADGIVAGMEIAEMVFRKLDPDLIWKVERPDGTEVKRGDVMVRFEGNYRALLTGERTALNFLQRLSGIATMAGLYAKQISDYKTEILDTRKTLPGFRILDKYAVRTGGAKNHRIGLYDMVMIKDNHIEVAGGIANAVHTVRQKIKEGIRIEVETTNLQQVEEAIEAGADIIMLDNMDTKTMKQCVERIGKRALIEASGNMTLDRLREVAATGVDYISIGALTHSVTALDISQQIED